MSGQIQGSGWLKSSFSFANGNCVEVSGLDAAEILVRNSRDPEGGVLRFTPAEWDAFLGGVRLGEFDRFGGRPDPSTREAAAADDDEAGDLEDDDPGEDGCECGSPACRRNAT